MSPGSRLRRSSKVSGRAASRCCCSATRSTVSGSATRPDYEGKPFKSVTQGAADLAAIALVDASAEPGAETSAEVADFLSFVKATLGDSVADVRASERLVESAVCLVAPATGPDRQFEKLLAAAGRLDNAAKPILEINPRHELVVALAGLGADRQGLREDSAHLLLDEARILDGERPSDAKAFSQRLARVMSRGVGAEAAAPKGPAKAKRKPSPGK